jgi:cytochrome c biogenesis protein CcmG/thiol:disulfide interchange protein DsbE
VKQGVGLRLAGLALAVALGLALWKPPQWAGDGAAPLLPPANGLGQPAPALDLPPLHDAAERKAPQDWRGRVWVLSVWASWCGPCREEHPLLLELARQGGVTLIGLNYKDDPRDAQEWLRQAGDPFLTTLVDRHGDVGTQYGVRGVPETWVIDSAGIIRHRHTGPLTAQVWQSDVWPLVQRLSAPPG